MYQPREIEQQYEQEVRHQLPDIMRPIFREPEIFRKMIAAITPVTEKYSAAGAPEIEFFRTNPLASPKCLILFRGREDKDGGTFSADDAEMLSGILNREFTASAMPFVGFHSTARPYTFADGAFSAQPETALPPKKEAGFIGRLAGLFNREKVEEIPAGPPVEMRSKVYVFPHDLSRHR